MHKGLMMMCVLGWVSMGCTYDTQLPQDTEGEVGEMTEAVVTRAKIIEYAPARMCEGIVSEVDAWGWTCSVRPYDYEGCRTLYNPAKRNEYLGKHLFFTPSDHKWHTVDDEISVANVERLSCHYRGTAEAFRLSTM